jgi:hypothetical protein
MPKNFLENTPTLKLRSRAHHWKETNRNEIMTDFTRIRITRAIFPGGKFWKHPYFCTHSVTGGFNFYSSFFILFENEKGQHCETRHNCKNCRVALCVAPFPTLPYGGRLLEL